MAFALGTPCKAAAFEAWVLLEMGPNRNTQVSKARPGPPT